RDLRAVGGRGVRSGVVRRHRVQPGRSGSPRAPDGLGGGRRPVGSRRRAARVPRGRERGLADGAARSAVRRGGREGGARVSTTGADVEAILLPVDAAAPAGVDLRYQPIYDEIKAARRLAEADPAEIAGWKKVAELALKAITRSKDLQLAIWLLEAFARIDGYRGASSGLL